MRLMNKIVAFSRVICASLQLFARRGVGNRDGEKQDSESDQQKIHTQTPQQFQSFQG